MDPTVNRSKGRVEGDTAIVTGARTGIGRATAELLAAEGATVVVTHYEEDGARDTVESICKNGGQAVHMKLDVQSEDDWKHVIDRTCMQVGCPTILVNNAGVYMVKPITEIEQEDWQQLFDINVKGVFLGMKHVVPPMRENGRGSIINMSSIAGLAGVAGHTCYGGSKGAVRLMTKDMAMEVAGTGIRVNSIHPGAIDTKMIREEGPSMEEFEEMHPVGRVGEPVDVAFGALYLASRESKFVTGTELVIDGGFCAN
ncbi:NAD(P)-dependent dehydrogenase (short-subunit alcohol dehydrogenase family) [Salinibacter ruber]|uniref:SDR family NAD(P)-dependent oxidoreductase n=1 Tax=Salinibacter ruber TaxID=146919 RepID=UPI0021675C9A|nr:glucose 1-dehydrogenase [Salinibacter ruber]MCS4139318.1 NAD(P)-dependent dehydrogenase (short-subunit alcohol dehydrogenase family) [Salinibacter ruber]